MSPRLLIVDDEPDIRNSLKRRFILNGYGVDTADGGESALAMLEQSPYQIVISDIKMPGMDGIELLRRIRSEYPMTRVIMMTGFVTLENGLSCLRHGADTCIFKPFGNLKEMDDAIRNALEFLQHWEMKLLQLKGLAPVSEDKP
jgi:DNA-binding NtrC family response regulator